MTSALPINGLTQMAVTVLSVNGTDALVRAEQGGAQAITVPRTILRAHSPLPQVGERWILDRSFGNTWTFAAIVGGDEQTPMIVVASAAARLAIQAPYPNMAVYQLDSYSAWLWTGTVWQERIPPAMTALQAQVNAMPKGFIAIVRQATDITISGTGWTVMETVSVPVVAGRTYEVHWTVNQASSLAAGPPNGTAAIITAPGSVLSSSPSLRLSGVRVYNSTQEVLEMTGKFSATVTETRGFGTAGNPSSSTATWTFYGLEGRSFSVEDKGLTPP